MLGMLMRGPLGRIMDYAAVALIAGIAVLLFTKRRNAEKARQRQAQSIIEKQKADRDVSQYTKDRQDRLRDLLSGHGYDVLH